MSYTSGNKDDLISQYCDCVVFSVVNGVLLRMCWCFNKRRGAAFLEGEGSVTQQSDLSDFNLVLVTS